MKSGLALASCAIIWAYTSNAAPGQERTWTDVDGRQITASAVSKTDKDVRLRFSDGKRASVALTRLSEADQDWVKDWKPRTFNVKEEHVKWPRFGTETLRKFRFEWGEPRTTSTFAIIFEDELADFLRASQKFFELAKKNSEGVKEYRKVLHEGKDRWGLVFVVREGKVSASGATLWSVNERHINPEDFRELFHFLEEFSPAEWDRQQREEKEELEKKFR